MGLSGLVGWYRGCEICSRNVQHFTSSMCIVCEVYLKI